MTMLFIKKVPKPPLVKRVLTRLGLPTQPDHWQAFWSGFLDGWVKAFVLVATIWLMWLALVLFIGVIL